MVAHPPLTIGSVESIARVLGEVGSGSDISRYLSECRLQDDSGQSTKWRRLNHIFLSSQMNTQSSNQILGFIKRFVSPTRFVGKRDTFEGHRQALNSVLLMEGLEFTKDGEFKKIAAALNLDEAQLRVNNIRSRLASRNIHPDVYKYCRPELMQDNYFHAVFEACKGLFHRIREMSGVEADGAKLIDQCFSVENPVIVFNTLQTETERSEHKGFAQLLKGCAAAIRNPLAHGPKIFWEGESDAADYLTLISMLHRKLDSCTKVPTAA